MKELFWILLFHFGLGAVVQPSPRSSPRVLADAPASASASGMLERIEHLSFGYERVSGAANVGMRSRPPVRNSLNSSVPVATQVRPRGCEFLLHDSGTGSDPLMTSKFTFDTLEQLPCVTLGSLIFLRFACIYGHEWTAVRGSYSTANCPQCVPSGRSRFVQKNARRRPLDSEKSLAIRLAQHAEAKGGKLLLPSSTTTSSSLPLRWKSKVEFQCSKGHKFSVVASNAIKQKNWCAACLHGPDLMHRTAEYFGGRFVGMVEDEPMTSNNLHEDFSQERRPRRRPRSLSLARWRCADGHEFQQTINNIRRSVGGSRGCSWCPSCSKLGKKFVWRGDARTKTE